MDMPFDKLPKFLAIAGLTLAIAGAALVYATYVSREIELIRRAELVAPYDAKTAAAWRSVSKLPPNTSLGSEASVAYAKQIFNALETARSDEEAKMSELFVSDAKLNSGKKLFRLQLLLGSLGALLGVGISGYGFKGWRDLERKERAEKEAVG
jgi:hypothetical protein